MIAQAPDQPAPAPGISDSITQGARPADPRLDDLAQIIAAYNQVTEKLQHSHEALEAEVSRLRVELEAKNAQLERSKRLSALGEMAAGIAHEVRNPLAAIQLYAGMAIEDLQDSPPCDTTDAAADGVRKIASAVHGLSGIVNDVLVFAGQAEPAPRELLVSDAVGRAVDAHLPAIEEAGVTVIRRDLSSPELAVPADPEMLQQVLLNLIRNAVDAMAGSTQPLHLTVGAKAREREVVITLTDTGPGIDAEDIDRIFNPFFTTRSTGTGLGLAIVHRILDAHGGSIRAWNDKQSGGAVFELTLPRDGAER